MAMVTEGGALEVSDLLEANDGDLLAIRDFVFFQHVEASSYSDASRAAQVSELLTDFPDLAEVGSAIDAGAPLRRGAWLYRAAATGEIVAAVGLKISSTSPEALDISYLFTHPRYRKRGLARRLLRRALVAAAAQDGVEAVRLLTLAGVYDAAVALYTSEKFRVYQRVEPSAGICPHYTLLYMQLDDLAPWRSAGSPAVAAMRACTAMRV